MHTHTAFWWNTREYTDAPFILESDSHEIKRYYRTEEADSYSGLAELHLMLQMLRWKYLSTTGHFFVEREPLVLEDPGMCLSLSSIQWALQKQCHHNGVLKGKASERRLSLFFYQNYVNLKEPAYFKNLLCYIC